MPSNLDLKDALDLTCPQLCESILHCAIMAFVYTACLAGLLQSTLDLLEFILCTAAKG
jgi:hypothetical protein